MNNGADDPSFLPYGRHSVDEADIAAVVSTLRHQPLSGGKAVGVFEAAFARAVGAEYAVAVSSGTAALHLAAVAGGLRPGSFAIVPAITFAATANAVRMAGADVIFADVDADTGLMTAETLERAIRSASGPVRAVFPVHLSGQCADMAAIRSLAGSHGMNIITDCCHALGCHYPGGGGPGDGTFESMGTFSLHPVKAIAMGEGGVITVREKDMADRLCRMRAHGLVRDTEHWLQPGMADDGHGRTNPWYYEMHELGWNYRASSLHCALGLSQLDKLDSFIARRRKLAAAYDTAFDQLDADWVRPVPLAHHNAAGFADHAYHLYPVLIDFAALGVGRADVMRFLAGRGIGTQVHYIPVNRQPYYTDLYGQSDLPGAERYYNRVLSLPLFPAMTDSDVTRVVDEFAKLAP